VRLGAFPVRRGQADADALETARVILNKGGLLALFPEGTRVRDPDQLGHPHRGAGRLALEAGAPLVPCAITGTEKIFRGGFTVPRRVQVAFSEPIPVSEPGGDAGRSIDADRGHAVARGRGRVPAAAGAADLDRCRAGCAWCGRRARRPEPPPQGPAAAGARSPTAAVKGVVSGAFRHFPSYIADN
jgi:1-acyl-sn-glycerol-3-phosphate acyltransferase